MTALKEAAARVQAAAHALGLTIEVIEKDKPTRTAEEAAAAAGCDVGQIVKSLVFRGKDTGQPYLLLVSGRNRVDEKGVGRTLGEALVRPDAHYVREVTGYAIGGIPPLGHKQPISTWIDKDLMAHAEVWAAAGTPESIFKVDPAALAERTGATVIAVT